MLRELAVIRRKAVDERVYGLDGLIQQSVNIVNLIAAWDRYIDERRVTIEEMLPIIIGALERSRNRPPMALDALGEGPATSWAQRRLWYYSENNPREVAEYIAQRKLAPDLLEHVGQFLSDESRRRLKLRERTDAERKLSVPRSPRTPLPSASATAAAPETSEAATGKAAAAPEPLTPKELRHRFYTFFDQCSLHSPIVALPDGTLRARTKEELQERAASVAALRRIASGSSSLRGRIEGNPGSRGILELGLPVMPLLVEHCDEEPLLAEIAAMLLGDELPTESTTSLKERAAVLKTWWAETGSKDPRFMGASAPPPSSSENEVTPTMLLIIAVLCLCLGTVALIQRRRHLRRRRRA